MTVRAGGSSSSAEAPGAQAGLQAVVFDVDDVVIDTDRATTAAERSVAAPLYALVGAAHAEAIGASFVRSYETLRAQLRATDHTKTAAFAGYEVQLARWQRGVIEAGHEVKMWSREVIAAIALEELGLPVTQALVTAASDRYWQVMTDETRIHADAAELIADLRARGIAVHLATNSDGFLRLDEARGTFVYDPSWAEARKLARLELLGALGLGPRDITVGDPIGKPNRPYYERVLADLARKLGCAVDPTRVIATGDSLTHDVLPFLELGARAGVWLTRRSGADVLVPHPEHARVWVTRDLRALRTLS